MTPERWQQIKTILDASAEGSPRDLSAFLQEACGGDDELRREVESFLDLEDGLGDFMDEPVAALMADPSTREPEEGRRIGPYRTVRLLGRGGMGAVYEAVREDEFEQRVALKLVRGGLLDPEMVRRFETERQILAGLEHPNIARLLDGGTSEDGTPFFAMEYVNGEPLDLYCDGLGLSTRERLELFLGICSALEFAHRNLVVHRDLKPGNILIDTAGTAKLLDFGIAKLLRPELALTAVATLPGRQPMTLQYASPEQLKDQPITTASDIYSLGVLLYRLLTGRLPCGLETTSFPTLVQAVCEEDPVRPSELVGRSEEIRLGDGEVLALTPESVSRSRDGDPRTLRRRLIGDVDSIVLRALRKEPEHRYASVEQFAADIRRHLDGLPVEARQGNFGYRLGKFVRRHRWGLTTAAAMVLLAAGFTVALFFQLERTERQRDRAERVSTLLVEVFRSSEPDRAAGEELTARELLDRGRRTLESGLEEEPEVRASLLRTLGKVYSTLGHHEEARDLLNASVAIWRRQATGDHPDLAMAVNDLAVQHYRLGENAEAEDLYREAIGMRRRLGEEGDLLKPMNNLASILLARGELDEAEELYRQGLERRRARAAAGHPDAAIRRRREANLATSLRSLANVLYLRGDFAAAEPLLNEALEIRQRIFGPSDTRVAAALSSLARLEHAQGRLDQAEVFFVEALEIRRQRLGDDHLHTAASQKDLAAVLLARGQVPEARASLEPALEILRRGKPEGDFDVADAESLLGALLTAEGRYPEAETYLLASYQRLLEQRGPQVLHTREARRRVVELYEAWGKPDRAAEFRSE